MAQSNDNTKTAEVDIDEVENVIEPEFDVIFGTSAVMKTTLVMAGGGSHWWNYIIESIMLYNDDGCWFPFQDKPHTVFIQNKDGITKCVGKRLIYNGDLEGGVRLVDYNYVIYSDDEEEYNGQNISK